MPGLDSTGPPQSSQRMETAKGDNNEPQMHSGEHLQSRGTGTANGEMQSLPTEATSVFATGGENRDIVHPDGQPAHVGNVVVGALDTITVQDMFQSIEASSTTDGDSSPLAESHSQSSASSPGVSLQHNDIEYILHEENSARLATGEERPERVVHIWRPMDAITSDSNPTDRGTTQHRPDDEELSIHTYRRLANMALRHRMGVNLPVNVDVTPFFTLGISDCPAAICLCLNMTMRLERIR